MPRTAPKNMILIAKTFILSVWWETGPECRIYTRCPRMPRTAPEGMILVAKT